ncbi:MAG: hypothetical protein A2161_04865 [Candidatus Schekmanbacteria bacterium RBG_13_48_7]|uniref:Prepilin-type N-terminal cleavage/methylation domain-containing protein n=1 Tax=Candidatus Schekmanbacteria bacterium RBG_13_48_7 TaxID=1817878 RepID=A0A1F7RTE7_9BACT|nr:MAG: hypothetical protein A2161_04865 [Candidatus Schekmanbacteria bacterium RBG_13_48_7]
MIPKYFEVQKGFSLIEIIFAVTILGIGLLSIASIIPFGIKAVDQSTKRSIATNLVNEGIERVKANPFKDVIDANFPFEDYGHISGHPEFSRSYEITEASDASSTIIPRLKMVTVRVFWRISDTHEINIYSVTYIGPKFK